MKRKKPKGIKFLKPEEINKINNKGKRRKTSYFNSSRSSSRNNNRNGFSYGSSSRRIEKYNGPIVDLTSNAKVIKSALKINVNEKQTMKTTTSRKVGRRHIRSNNHNNNYNNINKNNSLIGNNLFQRVAEIDPFSNALPSPLAKRLNRVQKGFPSANAYISTFLPLHINESIAQVRSQTSRLTRDVDHLNKIVPKTPPLRFIILSTGGNINNNNHGHNSSSSNILNLVIVGNQQSGYFENNVLDSQIHNLSNNGKKKYNNGTSNNKNNMRNRIRNSDVILFSEKHTFGKFRNVVKKESKDTDKNSQSLHLNKDNNNSNIIIEEELYAFSPAAFGIVKHVKYIQNPSTYSLPSNATLHIGEQVLFQLSIQVSSKRFENIFSSFSNNNSNNNFANRRICGWLIDSLNTAQREYDALLHVGRLNILDSLLHNQGLDIKSPPPKSKKGKSRGNSTSTTTTNDDDVLAIGNENDLTLSSDFRSYLKENYNRPQYDAIITSATQKGFTLIQGPPGTGKTQTLLGVLNTLHLHIFGKNHKKLHRNFLKLMGKLRKQCSFDATTGNLLDSSNSHFNSFKMENNRMFADPEYWWKKFCELELPPKPRILMCAPSNAAVDNVAYRILINKFVDGRQNKFHPRMIRIGSGQSSKVSNINGEAEVHNMLRLIDNPNKLYLETNYHRNKKNEAKQSMLEIFKLYFFKLMNPVNAMKITKEKGEELKRRFIACKGNYDDACFELEIREYIGDQLSQQQFNKNNNSRYNNRNRHGNINDIKNYLYMKFIGRAEIVFSTLSSTGLRILSENRFNVCLIDEAAQSTEISTLIPLKLGCDQCILCGDPQQLSAVVHCKNGAGSNMLYHQSLFERLQRGGHDVHFLLYQYRMHPLICSFPSQYFYGNRLKNGLPKEKFGKNYHKYDEYSPLVFYDLPISQESLTEKTLSYKNENEANYCINLLINLLLTFPNDISLERIGIISMYAEQVKLLRQKYDTILIPYLSKGKNQLQHVQNNINVQANHVIRTVDGFQGQEKDIIIVSTVRGDANSSEKGIGFIHDRQRLNVALTRAKYSLLVVGRKTSLETSEMWNDFIKHVEQNGKYICIDETKLNFRKTIMNNNNNNVIVGTTGNSSSSGIVGTIKNASLALPTTSLTTPIVTTTSIVLPKQQHFPSMMSRPVNVLDTAKQIDLSIKQNFGRLNHQNPVVTLINSRGIVNSSNGNMNIGNALINTTIGKKIVPPLLQPPPANAPPLLLPQQIIVSSTIKTSAKNRIGYEELEDGEIVD